jgi:hypothetical protein
MGRVARLVTRSTAVAVFATALVGVTATAAQAAPTGCGGATYVSWDGSVEGGMARCMGGTGHVRVRVYCTSNPATGYPYVWATGPWVPVPTHTSYKDCPASHPHAVAAAYEPADW